MCLSPKIGEEKKNSNLQKKYNIPKNYSKKNVSKLSTNKNTFSRNINKKSNQNNNQKSSRRIMSNHILNNSTSNNSSFKNLTNVHNPNNYAFNHKKSESSINFLSFMNQNINPNICNPKKIYYNNINDNLKINNSFFNEISNKEKYNKEILITKIDNKKIINRNIKSKNKDKDKDKICTNKTNKQYSKSKKNNINNNATACTTTYKNKSKNKILDNKVIINLENSPNTKKNISNKNNYYSKNVSPSVSRNIVFKSPSNVVIENNSKIKTFYKKLSMEKYNTDTYKINMNKNKNKNNNGNMFAIHKIFENNLFCNKMKEKSKKNYLSKKIDMKKNVTEGIYFDRTMNHSYNNNKKILNNNNISNNSLNISSNLIIFSSNQNSSDKNCLYKKNNYNKKFKDCLSSNNIENDNNKTYNYQINDKKKEFINIYNINSINKFDNSLYLKIENTYKNNENKEKEKMNISNNFNTSKENNINENKEERKIKKDKNIYFNKNENNKKEANNMHKFKEKENYTPEETHFEVIAFIQKIKHKNKTYA